MKKVLSVFLAVTMILAMIPTTFAAVDETTGAITYEFVATGNQNIVLEDANGVKNAAYMEYDSENGRDWAYLGTNWTLASAGTTNLVSMASGENGSLRCGANNNQNSWIAFKIKVPTTATYSVSGTAYHYKNGSAAMGVYIAPMNDNFSAETTIYGKVLSGERDEATSFGTGLGIDTVEDYIGKANIGDTSNINVRDITWTDTPNSVYMEAGKDYLLIFNQGQNKSKALTPASITLTPAKVDKTHEYVFNNTVLTGDILENEAFTDDYRMFYIPEGGTTYTGNYLDSYDNLNSILTDLWSVSTLGGYINDSSYKFTSSLGKNQLQMVGRKRLNNGANGDANFVLKLNVKYDGIYAVTADVGELTNGTQADIYMLPADETITDINSEMLKSYNSIGRVSNVTGEVDGDIGAVQLTTGDWYFVFAFNSTNNSTATNSRQYFNLEKITLTEIDALPETGTTPEAVEGEDIPEISFSATTSIPDKAAVTINGVGGNLRVLKPSIGDVINVSAPEVPGYKFIGWKSGSANDTGDGELANTSKFVKGLEQEDIFTVYTSTFLTAVYEELTPSESTASVVEFWNLDGSYLGQKTVDQIEEEGGLPTTSLIGHTFTGWFTAEDVALDIAAIVEKVTHAVAGYTADATLAATGDDGVRVNGVLVSEAVAYGDKVPCEDDGDGIVTHWLRDGKVVSYDPTYKYYVWDATNITSSYAPIEKKPLVVLDGETVSDAYMIEYDGAGKTIVEVGILFGTGTPTVKSKSEIFKSQRGENHGQFAAKPSDSSYIARGYMIYEDGGEYKVIYSE